MNILFILLLLVSYTHTAEEPFKITRDPLSLKEREIRSEIATLNFKLSNAKDMEEKNEINQKLNKFKEKNQQLKELYPQKGNLEKARKARQERQKEKRRLALIPPKCGKKNNKKFLDMHEIGKVLEKYN